MLSPSLRLIVGPACDAIAISEGNTDRTMLCGTAGQQFVPLWDDWRRTARGIPIQCRAIWQ
jgi:hypothetical protein